MKNFTLILCSLFFTIAAFGQDLVINVALCDDTASTVRIHGPWWNNWDPNGGPEATSNGDGTWTFTFSPAPEADMEYKILVNGHSEDLIGKGSCAAITDNANYANRQWKTSDPMTIDVTYNQCSECTTTKTSNAIETEGIVSVFPNPASNYLNVSSTSDFKRLNIVNIYGSVVKGFRLVGNFNVLDLDGLTPGVYFINAFSELGIVTEQIVVK